MSRRTALLLGALVLAGVVVGALLVVTSDSPDPADRAAVRAYVVAIEPLARQGGRVVVDGMRPAIGDLSGGRTVDLETARMAVGWQIEMGGVRARWALLTAPPRLTEAHRLFLESIDGYVRVATAIGRAARATGSAREAALDEAVRQGDAADDVYDRASRAVQAALRAVREPPVGWLPTPAESP